MSYRSYLRAALHFVGLGIIKGFDVRRHPSRGVYDNPI